MLYPERTVVTGISFSLVFPLSSFDPEIMRKLGAFILLLRVGMAGSKRPPEAPAGAKKKKGKKAATTTEKVPVPDIIPVVDTFNTSVENSENFDNSAHASRFATGQQATLCSSKRGVGLPPT
jgi:hypothetical protein